MTDDKKSEKNIQNEEYEKNKNKFYKYGKIFFIFGIIACIAVSIAFIMATGTFISEKIRYGY